MDKLAQVFIAHWDSQLSWCEKPVAHSQVCAFAAVIVGAWIAGADASSVREGVEGTVRAGVVGACSALVRVGGGAVSTSDPLSLIPCCCRH